MYSSSLGDIHFDPSEGVPRADLCLEGVSELSTTLMILIKMTLSLTKKLIMESDSVSYFPWIYRRRNAEEAFLLLQYSIRALSLVSATLEIERMSITYQYFCLILVALLTV